MSIGLAIKLARENIDLTEHGLAKETGLSSSDIMQIEKDEVVPSLHVLKKIAVTLGLQIPQLCTIEDSIREPKNALKRLQRELLLAVQPILTQRNTDLKEAS